MFSLFTLGPHQLLGTNLGGVPNSQPLPLHRMSDPARGGNSAGGNGAWVARFAQVVQVADNRSRDTPVVHCNTAGTGWEPIGAFRSFRSRN